MLLFRDPRGEGEQSCEKVVVVAAAGGERQRSSTHRKTLTIAQISEYFLKFDRRKIERGGSSSSRAKNEKDYLLIAASRCRNFERIFEYLFNLAVANFGSKTQ